MQKKNYFFSYLLIFIFYLAFSIILCKGHFFDFNNIIFGDNGDTRGFLFGDLKSQNPKILGPLESVTLSYDFIPILSILGSFFKKIFGHVGGHNFGIFISFPITSFATFLMLQRISRNIFVSFPLAAIFGFTPFAVMHAFNGHPYLAFNIFIPILFLFIYLRIFEKNISFKNTVLISFVLLLMLLSNPYYAFYSYLVIFYFFNYELFFYKQYKSTFFDYLIIFTLPSILFLIINFSFFYNYFFLDHNFSGQNILSRSFFDMLLFSVRPWQFFVPSIDSYFFGNLVESFSRKFIFGSNLVEQTFYLGTVLIFLILTTIYFYKKNIFAINEKKIISCFFYLLIFIFFMTLPPVILFNNFQVPTLNYITYDLFPMFRVLSRFNIFLIFVLVIICSITLRHIYLKNKKKVINIFLLITLLFIIEFLFISNEKISSLPEVPNAYYKIDSNKDTLIAEYPFVKRDNFHHYDYIMWQNFHKLRILNGFELNSNVNIQYFNNIQDLSSDKTFNTLKELGVSHIIIHLNKFKEGIIPLQIKKYFSYNLAERLFDYNVPLVVNDNFLLVYEDDHIQIYEL